MKVLELFPRGYCKVCKRPIQNNWIWRFDDKDTPIKLHEKCSKKTMEAEIMTNDEKD